MTLRFMTAVVHQNFAGKEILPNSPVDMHNGVSHLLTGLLCEQGTRLDAMIKNTDFIGSRYM